MYICVNIFEAFNTFNNKGSIVLSMILFYIQLPPVSAAYCFPFLFTEISRFIPRILCTFCLASAACTERRVNSLPFIFTPFSDCHSLSLSDIRFRFIELHCVLLLTLPLPLQSRWNLLGAIQPPPTKQIEHNCHKQPIYLNVSTN